MSLDFPSLLPFPHQHLISNIKIHGPPTPTPTLTFTLEFTGGTDICSLFAGMNTALPVYRGEIQCRMLGMGVMAFGEPSSSPSPSSLPENGSGTERAPRGLPVPPNTSGELVCVKPFPVQPLGFWPLAGYGAPEEDVRRARERYRESYYVQFEGVWCEFLCFFFSGRGSRRSCMDKELNAGLILFVFLDHGDHVVITESREGNGGGVVMLGRSDGVLSVHPFSFLPSN